MIYYMDRAECPTIPVPHDCVISNLTVSDHFLILDFEQDISRYDSIQNICPNAKSLTIKVNIIDRFDIYQMKIRKFPRFKKLYAQIDFDRLASLVRQKRVEYLYHYVAYQSLIVNLYYKTNIILDLQTDHMEYIWEA